MGSTTGALTYLYPETHCIPRNIWGSGPAQFDEFVRDAMDLGMLAADLIGPNSDTSDACVVVFHDSCRHSERAMIDFMTSLAPA